MEGSGMYGEMPSRRRGDPTTKRDPIHEAIALRAYELYLERGGADGHAIEDWLRAERELASAAARTIANPEPRP
jgi:hypothetical protein